MENRIVHNEQEEDELRDWDNWNPMSEDFISSLNSLALNPDKDPLSVVTGKVRPISSKVGNVNICERFARYGDCADGEYCTKLHVNPKMRERIRVLENTYELNKNRVIMNYTFLSPIEMEADPEALLLASVTNSQSPVNFYVIFPYDTMNFSQHTSEDLDFYIERVQTSSSAKIKLQKCHEQLAAIFDHPYRVDNVNDDIYPSQIVACKLSDGRFRRAMVNSLPETIEDAQYKLFLIDVGIEVEVPREQIYDIKAHCLSEPPMAVNCRLDLKPPNGQLKWSEQALHYFTCQTRSEAKYIYCTILGYIEMDRIFTIDLFNLKDRQSLSESMVSKGLAEKCQI